MEFYYFEVGCNIVRCPKEDIDAGYVDGSRIQVLVWNGLHTYHWEHNYCAVHIAEHEALERYTRYESVKETIEKTHLIELWDGNAKEV